MFYTNMSSSGVKFVKLGSTFSSREIHVWRMVASVFWSIILQLVFLFVFITFINTNIFHPHEWVLNCFQIITSFGLWIKVFALIIVIFLQGVVCSKNYVTGPTYCATRFTMIKNMFSIHNLTMGSLQMFIGMTLFWVYSSFCGDSYNTLSIPCSYEVHISMSDLCWVEKRFFLLLGGFWIGFYYFVRDYVFGSRSLKFPLIQQYKFIRVKVALKENIIKRAMKFSVLPTLLFFIMYYVHGGHFRSWFSNLLSLKLNSEPLDGIFELMNVQLIFYMWLFSSVFVITMQLMEMLFNIHLTEHCVFPISLTILPPGDYITLTEALKMEKVPIIQHLGYLDLYILSERDQERREELFTISQPGGHPHSWNSLIQECCKMITTFTNNLDCVINKSNSKEEEDPKFSSKPMQPSTIHFHSHNSGIRNRSSPPNIRNLSSPPHMKSFPERPDVQHPDLMSISQQWIKEKIYLLCEKPYFAYFFAESPESRIRFLLLQSQPVIWAVQSISFLASASLTEDKYGVVQKDLKTIILTILDLKEVLDELFKQNLNLTVKKSYALEPFDVQMKYALRMSLKRSLYEIAVTFGNYVKDIGLPSEAERQMNNFLALKEV